MNRLPEPATDWAIFLDVDGTLVEIADHPDAVRPARQLRQLLTELATAVGGAVALVSGRSVAAIDDLMGDLRLPAAGLHGLQLRTADLGCRITAEDDADITAARRILQNFVQDNPELYLEDKQATLALYFRGAPRARAAALEVIQDIVRQSQGRLEVLNGKSVFELKPAHGDKGEALRELLATPPFHGRRPVYVGDDVTDEDGFRAVNELGGISIRVGDIRDSAARYQLNSVNEVLEWLQHVAATLTGPRQHPT